MHSIVGGGAERAEHHLHFVLLDQLACVLNRFRRRVRIVHADELDLPAVDAAFGIDLLEVCLLSATDDTKARQRTAVGQRLSDADFTLGVRMCLR